MDINYDEDKRIDEIDRIFTSISKKSDKINKMLETIEFNQKIDRDNLFIKIECNAAKTTNDKFVEIADYFKKHDVDFYEDIFLKYIIENDLIKLLNSAYNTISKYFLELNIYYENRLKHSNFFGIRSRRQKKIDSANIKDLNEIISQYFDINNKIKNYKLDKNLIKSIIAFIERQGIKWYKNNIGSVDIIENEFDNLDLSDLVVELENTIKEKGYNEILPNSEVIYNLMSKNDIEVINIENKKISKKHLEELKDIRSKMSSIYKSENYDKETKKVA